MARRRRRCSFGRPSIAPHASAHHGARPSPQVLFRPLAELCITDAVRNIIDAQEARDIRKSGFPDMVMLTQLDGDEGAAMPVAPPPHAPNAPHAPATPQPMAPAS